MFNDLFIFILYIRIKRQGGIKKTCGAFEHTASNPIYRLTNIG